MVSPPLQEQGHSGYPWQQRPAEAGQGVDFITGNPEGDGLQSGLLLKIIILIYTQEK